MGRRAELKTLSESYWLAQQDSMQVILMTGELGIGAKNHEKTRTFITYLLFETVLYYI